MSDDERYPWGEIFADLQEKCSSMYKRGYRWVSVIADNDQDFQFLSRGERLPLDSFPRPVPEGIRFSSFEDGSIPDWVMDFIASDDKMTKQYSKNKLFFAKFNDSVTELRNVPAVRRGGLNHWDFKKFSDEKSSSGVFDKLRDIRFWDHPTVFIWNHNAIKEGVVFEGTGDWKYEPNPTPFSVRRCNGFCSDCQLLCSSTTAERALNKCPRGSLATSVLWRIASKAVRVFGGSKQNN